MGMIAAIKDAPPCCECLVALADVADELQASP